MRAGDQQEKPKSSVHFIASKRIAETPGSSFAVVSVSGSPCEKHTPKGRERSLPLVRIMAEEDKYMLNLNSSQKGNDGDLFLTQYTHTWGDKLTFTVGVGYFVGIAAGAVYGTQQGIRRARRSRFAKREVFSGTLFKWVLRTSNATAAASCLFVCVNKILDIVFEEELEDVGSFGRSLISGIVTGGVFKSTLGRRPTVVGALLGGILVPGLASVLDRLYEQGAISFKSGF